MKRIIKQLLNLKCKYRKIIFDYKVNSIFWISNQLLAYMNKHMTIQRFFIVSLLVILFKVSAPQFYNKRTKCSSNQFIFSVEWANFMMNMQYSSAAINQFLGLLPVGDQIYHYGLQVIQTPSGQASKEKSQCKNFYMHDNICCHYNKIDSLIATTIKGYRNSYYQAKFPIVDLIYKIYAQNKNFTYCTNFTAFYLPGIDGYTFSNATLNLSKAISQIQTQIQIIQNYQIQQLKNGLCLFCLGIQDLKTFTYPKDQSVKLSKAFLINQDYFRNTTNFIADVMWNISQTATTIQTFIMKQLNGNVNGNRTNCSKIHNYVSNSTEIKKRMVCKSFNQCLQFAETYFGTPGASSYMKVFDHFNRFQNMGVTYNRILVGSNFGFQGNVTYQPYKRTVPPIIGDIKGNSYDPFS